MVPHHTRNARASEVSALILVCTFIVVSSGLLACSGADNPPPANLDSQGAALGSGSGGSSAAATEASACAPEGATLRCGAVLSQEGKLAVCSVGTRTCAGGAWSACAMPSAPSTRLVAAAEGCDDKPAAANIPCEGEGRSRVCVVYTGGGNCFRGVEVCTAGFWSHCESAPSNDASKAK